ncbi:MAG: di-trans,poly-cis-decaprenylcistransferase [Clostridia bacterium]|nr:di-trans,poly-cis-decaprenylcistransferase [Clostridia bacterium]
MLFRKKRKPDFNKEKMPRHIAFICDGNRRWARSRALPTLLGHKEGVEAIKRIIRRGAEIDLENLTFFCFSTENFDRSKEEIDYLFNLFRELKKLVDDLIKRDYRFHHTGDRSLLPQDMLDIIDECEAKTANCKRGTVNIAMAYGGRNDIVNATKRIIKEKVKPEEINEETFKNYLTTGAMPDIDLLVRTSGEQRISGFMLYNMPYAELYFVKKHWPSFQASDLDDCIAEFQSRHRRFGK